ncbi:MAG: hypothetical protein MUF38_14360 [Anaerolineae bacterium]|nr:hypothetical protein [Anaerolineae bacterium]
MAGKLSRLVWTDERGTPSARCHRTEHTKNHPCDLSSFARRWQTGVWEWEDDLGRFRLPAPRSLVGLVTKSVTIEGKPQRKDAPLHTIPTRAEASSH